MHCLHVPKPRNMRCHQADSLITDDSSTQLLKERNARKNTLIFFSIVVAKIDFDTFLKVKKLARAGVGWGFGRCPNERAFFICDSFP